MDGIFWVIVSKQIPHIATIYKNYNKCTALPKGTIQSLSTLYWTHFCAMKPAKASSVSNWILNKHKVPLERCMVVGRADVFGELDSGIDKHGVIIVVQWHQFIQPPIALIPFSVL